MLTKKVIGYRAKPIRPSFERRKDVHMGSRKTALYKEEPMILAAFICIKIVEFRRASRASALQAPRYSQPLASKHSGKPAKMSDGFRGARQVKNTHH